MSFLKTSFFAVSMMCPLFVFADSTHSNVSALAVGCVLSQKIAVSPLNEDLNSTQGSGRGVDVAIYSDGDQVARLGNLNLSDSTGSSLKLITDAYGGRHYRIMIPDSDAYFELSISAAEASGGYYGTAPTSESFGELTYTTDIGQKLKLAELICSP